MKCPRTDNRLLINSRMAVMYVPYGAGGRREISARSTIWPRNWYMLRGLDKSPEVLRGEELFEGIEEGWP